MNNSTNVITPFRDLAFFTSCVTAFLFSVGYLYETAFLEVFKLNNSELFPDIPTSIIYGYRYATLTYISVLISIVMVTIFSVTFFTAMKSEFKRAIGESSFLSEHASKFQVMFTKNYPSFYFYLGLTFLYILLVLSAVKEGRQNGLELKESQKIECIYYKTDKLKQISGRLIRVNRGLVAFWDKSNDQTLLIQKNQLMQLTYTGCIDNESGPE